jgi:hypothetical protein
LGAKVNVQGDAIADSVNYTVHQYYAERKSNTDAYAICDPDAEPFTHPDTNAEPELNTDDESNADAHS